MSEKHINIVRVKRELLKCIYNYRRRLLYDVFQM